MSVSRTQIEREWTARGFTCGLWVDPPGQVWEDYRHPVDELLMVVEGNLEVEIEGERLHPTVGSELLIQAGARHSVRNLGRDTARWLYGYRNRA